MSAQNHFTKTAEDLLDRVRASTADAEKQLASAYKSARKTVTAGAKAADKTIRENPYQTLAVAFGVGVLVGALLFRRED